MDPVSAVATLGIVAGALVATGVIVKTLINVYKFIRGLDDASKIIKDLPEWQSKVNLAMKELHPNSGSSLKDQVTALNTHVALLNAKACETGDKVDTMGNSLSEIRDMLQSHVEDDQLHSR